MPKRKTEQAPADLDGQPTRTGARILVRMDDEIKKGLEALAKKNRRSVNSEILVAIERHVEREQA